jgi:hypothetical protein
MASSRCRRALASTTTCGSVARLGLTAGRAPSCRHLQIVIVGWSAAAHPALSSSVIRAKGNQFPLAKQCAAYSNAELGQK